MLKLQPFSVLPQNVAAIPTVLTPIIETGTTDFKPFSALNTDKFQMSYPLHSQNRSGVKYFVPYCAMKAREKFPNFNCPSREVERVLTETQEGLSLLVDQFYSGNSQIKYQAGKQVNALLTIFDYTLNFPVSLFKDTVPSKKAAGYPDIRRSITERDKESPYKVIKKMHDTTILRCFVFL